ncbi:hypothetical protein HRQ91_05000 [Treponema parvum]|uniref:Xylose transport system permease protein XylH n=1 Tax=Treponema parvum TaxID=138851 RepID=A0A975F3B2_9SPIR|nr:hypothetical protein [Treponema parvum]QTQ13865.1 hypothetical protein HRQ91_05000 [Treponema parvum]
MSKFLEYRKLIKPIGMFIGIIAMLLLFNSWTNNVFSSVRNLTLLMKQGSVLMIVACGLMILLIERNFDLSGGAAVYFVSVCVSMFVVNFKWNLYLSIFLAMLIGLLMGAFNGIFVGLIGVPAFIGTLASQLMFKGIGYTWTDAATIGPIPENFAWLSEGYIPPAISALIIGAVMLIGILYTLYSYNKMKLWYGGVRKLAANLAAIIVLGGVMLWVFLGYYGIPMCVFFAMLMVGVTAFISNKTVFGRHIYIIGGNPEAAAVSGIKLKKRVFQSYLYMGCIYGVAGVIISARLGGSTATSGNLIELDAVAAACIGGTSMSGGVGRISGVVMGVFILACIDNVMSLMNVSSYLQMFVKGFILLLAVCMDVYANQSRFKLKKKKS